MTVEAQNEAIKNKNMADMLTKELEDIDSQSKSIEKLLSTSEVDSTTLLNYNVKTRIVKLNKDMTETREELYFHVTNNFRIIIE